MQNSCSQFQQQFFHLTDNCLQMINYESEIAILLLLIIIVRYLYMYFPSWNRHHERKSLKKNLLNKILEFKFLQCHWLDVWGIILGVISNSLREL